MKALALDTSSNACSVAVTNGDDVIERHVIEPRQHTRILLPMIEDALEDAGLQLKELDRIVLGNGPGSFIGLRIAASVAQGLAFGSGLRISPVSSLAAVAAEVIATEEAEAVAVTQDARMNEVYFGLFRPGFREQPALVGVEQLQSAQKIDWPDDTKCVAAGAGWSRYPALLQLNAGHIASESRCQLPRARYLIALGKQVEPIEPQRLTPAYLRTKVAEPQAPKRLS